MTTKTCTHKTVIMRPIPIHKTRTLRHVCRFAHHCIIVTCTDTRMGYTRTLKHAYITRVTASNVFTIALGNRLYIRRSSVHETSCSTRRVMKILGKKLQLLKWTIFHIRQSYRQEKQTERAQIREFVGVANKPGPWKGRIGGWSPPGSPPPPYPCCWYPPPEPGACCSEIAKLPGGGVSGNGELEGAGGGCSVAGTEPGGA